MWVPKRPGALRCVRHGGLENIVGARCNHGGCGCLTHADPGGQCIWERCDPGQRIVEEGVERGLLCWEVIDQNAMSRCGGGSLIRSAVRRLTLVVEGLELMVNGDAGVREPNP